MKRNNKKGLLDFEISLIGILISIAIVLAGIFIITIVFVPKEKQSVETVTTDDSGQELVLIREKDGLKVYRFYDKGYWRYFVDGRGKTMTTIDERKGTSRNRHTETTPDEIETTEGK